MLDLDELRSHLKALDSPAEANRRKAIHALKQVPAKLWSEAPADTLQAIVKALQHQLTNGIKQPVVRQAIIVTLGHIGAAASPTVPQLTEFLAEGTPDNLREATAVALGRIGKPGAKPAVQPLLKVLEHCPGNVAVSIAEALHALGSNDHRIKDRLLTLWQSPIQPPTSPLHIAIALCKLRIDAQGATKYLTTTLVTHPDPNQRQTAAEALGACPKDAIDVVPALMTAIFNDKNDNVRQMAEQSLKNLHLTHDKAIVLCAKQLKDSTYAENALRKGGTVGVPGLIEALKDKENVTREKAVRTLGGLGETAAPAVPALTAALKDKHPTVRLAVSKALWNITKDADLVVPVLVTLLEDKSPAVMETEEIRRQYLQTVIETLRRIGPPAKAALPALNKKTKDKIRLISESAIGAMKEISANGVAAPIAGGR